MNSGFEEAGSYDRSEKVGDKWVATKYNTFAPMVLAAIGRVPETVEDRCITILMKRRLKTETIERLTRRNRKVIEREATALASRLARWIGDNIGRLSSAKEPGFPPGLDDRCQDNWDLLLLIGDLAGATWAAAARKAVVELSVDRNDDTDGALDIKLLTDIETILNLALHSGEVIGSTELRQALIDKGAPWNAMGKNQKELSGYALAQLLRPFGARPKHDNDGNGYKIAVLRDAISRYAAKNTPNSFTPSQPQENQGESGESSLSPDSPNEGIKTGNSPYSTRVSEGVKELRCISDSSTEKTNGTGWAGPAHRCSQCGLPVDIDATCGHCGAAPRLSARSSRTSP
jgi:hypothetical protein